MSVWEPLEITLDRTAHWTVGPLDLWLRRTGDEWTVAVERGLAERPCAAALTDEVPDLPWRRWAGHTAGRRARLLPLLPDRPVVVRPVSPLNILPGEESRFFIGVPLWIRLALTGDGGEITLCEEYTQQLSNTWFGTPVDGVFCYALPSRARQRLEDIQPAAHRAVCPLQVRNRSKESLEVQKLCLHVGHLGLYQGNARLWAGESSVTHLGSDTDPDVQYPNAPPAAEAGAPLLTPPRTPPQAGMAHRMVDKLRTWAQGL